MPSVYPAVSVSAETPRNFFGNADLTLRYGFVAIYGLYCPNTGILRYIGKTINPSSRLRAHCSPFQLARRKHSHHKSWLMSLAKSGVRPVMKILEWVTPENWDGAEREWIAAARAAGYNLTNTSPGGETSAGGIAGRKMSDAAKRRMSARRRAMHASGELSFSDDHRRKISAGNKGKKRTEEQRARYTEANRLKADDPSFRQKLRDACDILRTTGVYAKRKRSKEHVSAMRDGHKKYYDEKRGLVSSSEDLFFGEKDQTKICKVILVKEGYRKEWKCYRISK